MVNSTDLEKKYISIDEMETQVSVSHNAMLKSGSIHVVVQGSPTLNVLLKEDAFNEDIFFSKKGLFCRFNGFLVVID